MCGISGLFGRTPVADLPMLLERMKKAIRHRGPDGEGSWASQDSRVGLAHLRLSIIDLSTGAQPMASPSGNVITYNGEIYNFIELRKELGGADFRTTSDTEVILRAYEKWGERCVEKLRGMFAFALWDAAKG
jgi:asparagine synthase (glutamine-hydrolysing)